MLQEIADLLEIAGENPFKSRAYRKAAREVENRASELDNLIESGRLKEIPGIGEAIAAKVTQFAREGSLPYLEKLRGQIPPGVRQLIVVPGVGPRLAHLFYRQKGIDSLESLEKAARERRLRDLPGVGTKVELNILHSLERMKNRPAEFPLFVCRSVAEEIKEGLGRLPEVQRVEVAGSIRRWREMNGDVDLVVSSREPEQILAYFTALPALTRILDQREARASALHRSGVRVDLRVVPPEEFAATWLYLTGSRTHQEKLAKLAGEQGLILAENGLFPEEGGLAEPIREEADLYHRLGLEYIPPELREDRGEIEAATAHSLPSLVGTDLIRGDLHVHTTWSDGASTLREMRDAAARRGYEYLAICDHSHSLGITRGLDAARLQQQAEEIRALNEEGSPVTLLRGSEVDILGDGRLDFPDEILADLDVVVASIHTGMKQDADQLWRRVEQALKNPHVDILAHPSGRLLGHRGPHALDLEQVIELAAKTGTVLEINSFPDRLDLNDEMARLATEKGVTISIDTDSHHADQLEYVAYGVATARRAWVQPGMVLNTLPLEDLRKRLAKRGQA